MDLGGDPVRVVLRVGSSWWGMLIDRRRIQLGYLLNLILPSCGQRFAQLLAPNPGGPQ